MLISNREAYRIVLKEYPDVLTTGQVAEILGICKKTVGKLIRNREISSLQIGRAYRVPKVMLLQYLKLMDK